MGQGSTQRGINQIAQLGDGLGGMSKTQDGGSRSRLEPSPLCLSRQLLPPAPRETESEESLNPYLCHPLPPQVRLDG